MGTSGPAPPREANGIENDAVAWHWNQVESAERAAEVGDERQLDYLKRMVAGQAGKAQRRGRTLTVLRDYVATCTSLGREPQAAALLAMLNENERVLGVIENSMHPIAEPLNSAQLAEGFDAYGTHRDRELGLLIIAERYRISYTRGILRFA